MYSSLEFDITDNVKVTLLQKEFGKTVYIKKRCQTVTNIQSDSAFVRVKKWLISTFRKKRKTVEIKAEINFTFRASDFCPWDKLFLAQTATAFLFYFRIIPPLLLY